MTTYEAALWHGKAPNTMDASIMQRELFKVPDSASESAVTKAAKLALGVGGMKHRRTNEGDRVVLDLGQMFVTIDVY